MLTTYLYGNTLILGKQALLVQTDSRQDVQDPVLKHLVSRMSGIGFKTSESRYLTSSCVDKTPLNGHLSLSVANT